MVGNDYRFINIDLVDVPVPDSVREKLKELFEDSKHIKLLRKFDVALFRALFGLRWQTKSGFRWWSHTEDELFLLAVIMRVYFVVINEGKSRNNTQPVHSSHTLPPMCTHTQPCMHAEGAEPEEDEE